MTAQMRLPNFGKSKNDATHPKNPIKPRRRKTPHQMTHAEYKQERQRRGLTQDALAALLGVRQSTISDRERGRREITREAELALRSLSSANTEMMDASTTETCRSCFGLGITLKGDLSKCPDCSHSHPSPGSELVWANAKPTEPGWYWVRGKDFLPLIVEFERNLRTGRLFCAWDFPIYCEPYEWAGPIPFPNTIRQQPLDIKPPSPAIDSASTA